MLCSDGHQKTRSRNRAMELRFFGSVTTYDLALGSPSVKKATSETCRAGALKLERFLGCGPGDRRWRTKWCHQRRRMYTACQTPQTPIFGKGGVSRLNRPLCVRCCLSRSSSDASALTARAIFDSYYQNCYTRHGVCTNFSSIRFHSRWCRFSLDRSCGSP